MQLAAGRAAGGRIASARGGANRGGGPATMAPVTGPAGQTYWSNRATGHWSKRTGCGQRAAAVLGPGRLPSACGTRRHRRPWAQPGPLAVSGPRELRVDACTPRHRRPRDPLRIASGPRAGRTGEPRGARVEPGAARGRAARSGRLPGRSVRQARRRGGQTLVECGSNTQRTAWSSLEAVGALAARPPAHPPHPSRPPRPTRLPAPPLSPLRLSLSAATPPSLPRRHGPPLLLSPPSPAVPRRQTADCAPAPPRPSAPRRVQPANL